MCKIRLNTKNTKARGNAAYVPNSHDVSWKTNKRVTSIFQSRKNKKLITDWLPLKGEQHLLLEGLLVPDGEVPEGDLQVQHQLFHASTFTVLYISWQCVKQQYFCVAICAAQ
jgi:hypothetical protein